MPRGKAPLMPEPELSLPAGLDDLDAGADEVSAAEIAAVLREAGLQPKAKKAEPQDPDELIASLCQPAKAATSAAAPPPAATSSPSKELPVSDCCAALDERLKAYQRAAVLVGT